MYVTPKLGHIDKTLFSSKFLTLVEKITTPYQTLFRFCLI